MKRRLGRIFLILPVVLLLLPFLLGMRPPQDRGKPSSSVKIGKGGVRTILSPRNAREYKPGELLVRFKTGTATNKISALHSSLGSATLLESRMVPRLQLVQLPKRLSVEAAVTQFRKSGLVLYAEPNWKRYIQGTPYPNDPLVQIQPQALTNPLCDGNLDLTGHETKMWDLQMPNQCTSLDPQICLSGYTCAGQNVANTDISVLPCTDGDCSVNEPLGAFTDVVNATTQDVIVMSIDTGVDYTHPDLAANMWRNPFEVAGNGLDDDQNGIVDDVFGLLSIGLGAEGPGCSNQFGDPMDDHFHGSHTSGTMIARANNFAGLIGMGGLSSRLKVMACKFLDASGSGFTGDAIKCFEYAHDQKVNRGQNIIASNNSWGGGPFSQALEDAIAANRDAGILTVFSAGNANSDNDTTPTFPTNMDVDNIISVGAYNQHDCASGFSNFGGRSVDIFAPGTLIASACPWNTSNCSGDPNFNYVYASGTSMAAPHVTGLIGLLKVVNPTLTAAQIKNTILTTGVLSSNSDTICSSLAPGDDVDAVTSYGYQPTFQSFSGNVAIAGGGSEANKKSVTDKRINALRAAQIAASPAGTAGDYNLGAVIWPFAGGRGKQGVPLLIKVINVNGQNVGAAGSVTANVTFQAKTPIFTESFSLGTLPVGWQNIDNGDCGVAWSFDNPGGRDLFDDNFAIADSDAAGVCNMDATLRTPLIVASVCDVIGGESILLDFANNFNDYFYTSEIADVNVTTDAFSTVTNVLSMSGTDDVDPKSIDITAAVSANPATTQVEFKYYNAYFSYWHAIDDVSVSCFNPTVIPCGSGPTAFLDDGVYPDQVAGDGIFALNFIPGSLSGCSGPGLYSLTVNVNGSPLETLTLDVSAGLGAGLATVTPDALNFAFVPVGSSKSLPIHVRNTGDTVFQITGVTKASGVDFTFNDFGGTFPINVSPGGQVDGSVTFTPTTSGLLSDTLTINTDVGDPFVDMSGMGVGPNPDIHVTPTSIDFGTAGSGTVLSSDVTVLNNGPVDLHISGIDFPDPNLSTTSTFPITVSPAGSTTVNVTWTAPSADAVLDVQAVLSSDDPDEAAVYIHVFGNSLACAFTDDYAGLVIDPSKWTVLSNTFIQAVGDLIGSSLVGRAKIIATGFAGCGNNCTISTTMSTTGGPGGKFSLIGWYANNGNYAEVRMNEAADKWQIRHKANGSLKKQTANATILPGQVYDVVFSFDGTNFTLTVDGGAPMITLPKVAGSNPSGTGGYFVRKTNGSSSFICIQ